MERLVTTAQAAEILGLSLQGIHYRIRNKKLKSIKQGGKTYVYISDDFDQKIEQPVKDTAEKESLVGAKNEQIALLKKTIKWLKRQHQEEMLRLEKNQQQIIEVFKSEINLLQSAFNEMRSIYKPQLQNTSASFEHDSSEESEVQSPKERFISLQDFTLYMKKHHKSANDIKMIILKALHARDRRFMYNKKTKKILILNKDFSDLV